MLPRKLGSRRR